MRLNYDLICIFIRFEHNKMNNSDQLIVKGQNLIIKKQIEIESTRK